MASITVHHLDHSRSSRILWLLEELEVDYELVTHRRTQQWRAPESLKKVHPLGKAPVVDVDGQILAESGAIVEHLAQHLGDGRLHVPADSEHHRDYRFFLHYAEGSVMTPLLVKLLMNKVRAAPVPFFVKPMLKSIAGKVDGSYTNGEITLHSGFLDQHLKDREWFVGERLSGADIQMSFPVVALLSRATDADLPHLQAWKERMEARPAFQRAIDKGGPMV